MKRRQTGWEHRRRPWMHVVDNDDSVASDLTVSVLAGLVFVLCYLLASVR